MNHDQDMARKIVGILEKGVSRLDAMTVGRLADARASAVNSMSAHRDIAHSDIMHAGIMRFIYSRMHGQRAWITAFALLIAALLTLVLLQQDFFKAPVETDALLLASDLPPEAYADKGFHAWLENSSHSQL